MPDNDTKTRILIAAETIFAEKGYQNATVAEICERAEANIAAVNYHFGNKVKLYEAVLRFAYEVAQKKFPSQGKLSSEVCAESRLETFIQAMILRAFCTSSAGAFPKFIVHEMTNPTELLESVMRELMHREINVLKEILKVLLPEEVPEFRRRFFGFNIMSMVMYFSFSEPARRKFMAGKHLTPEQVNRLIRHITLFTLSGLKSAVDQLDENLEKYPMAQDRNCSDKLPGNDKGE